jgi:hypothetical protein
MLIPLDPHICFADNQTQRLCPHQLFAAADVSALFGSILCYVLLTNGVLNEDLDRT